MSGILGALTGQEGREFESLRRVRLFSFLFFSCGIPVSPIKHTSITNQACVRACSCVRKHCFDANRSTSGRKGGRKELRKEGRKGQRKEGKERRKERKEEGKKGQRKEGGKEGAKKRREGGRKRVRKDGSI